MIEEGVELVEKLNNLNRSAAGRDLSKRHHVAEQNCQQNGPQNVSEQNCQQNRPQNVSEQNCQQNSRSGVFKGYATMPWHTPLASEAPVAG